MKSNEIRSRFLEFFRKRNHAIIPSASLVTSDEKGVTNPTLFNTAGMQPLIPYLLGAPHPEGKRLANSQKCLRTVDIDDIGDKTHATFFEMLGNWSLGDYFKKEAIEWSYEFLTSKSDAIGDRGLGLDPNRLYITVFDGDKSAPKDVDAAKIWGEIFSNNGVPAGDYDGSELSPYSAPRNPGRNDGNSVKTPTLSGGQSRIFFMPATSNWWEAGDNGPCGPDSEMYYDVSNKFGGKLLTIEEFIAADANRDVVEVWNDVFMQYEKKDGKIVGNLPNPSIDTGAGLERLAMTLQGVDNIYDTDLLKPVMEKVDLNSDSGFMKEKRIIADHIRSSSFMIADGVIPSNTDRGYILRRLLRRAIRYADVIKMKVSISSLISIIGDTYNGIYPEIEHKKDLIISEIEKESERFRKTLDIGLKEFGKLSSQGISGQEAFKLFSSYGLPIDMISDLAKEKGIAVDLNGFDAEFKKHQNLSRAGAEQKFKGGLADTSDPMVVRYHTATHLLHQALHDVLGDSVMQKGSNITAERLRFDFAHGAKMTDEEKKRVEFIVNEKIAAKLPVDQITLVRDEAEKTGARHFFAEKYGDQVSIYYIGSDLTSAYSKEFCGGPHVSNTAELAGPEGKWRFKIQKEEAVSQGIRRIKAVLN